MALMATAPKITVHVADLDEVRNLLGQLELEREIAQREAAELAGALDAAHAECGALAADLAMCRDGLRAQIATDIEAAIEHYKVTTGATDANFACAVYRDAARIARGES